MKVSNASLLALLLPTVSARFIEPGETDRVMLYPDGIPEAPKSTQKFLIELAPGETRWVTEDEKWELRRAGRRFFDITDHQDLGRLRTASKKKSVFPETVTQQKAVNPLLEQLSKKQMEDHLTTFTGFYTRYYRSDEGRKSSEWLLSQVRQTIKDANAEGFVRAEPFQHSWGQNSIIATIPGQTNSTIVIGAHQDSINLFFPSFLAAPGADDDGSGTVTILEAFRVLLQSQDVLQGKAQNTIEFHWYSAEEGGLLGSQAIFSAYEKQGRDVKAMLQQDMTGYVKRTLDAGKPESVGVIVDYVDKNLTEFIKKVIKEYCTIPFVETKCGYACSDHASASKAGYPSAFVIESDFDDSDPHIHTTDDTISHLSFDHMLQHARMTLAFAYELAFTDFVALEEAKYFKHDDSL
ncbi:aminopeptidase-like protein [Thermochaetoides thermophila DSM 1495]|uniref:Peptide hydrolase n=1 Tax=Chaetomium thermophilum (strain DSM 1495 / CBS 144.50 / IMI 039719) TaxID=759272 RepID=G0S799_CHATD|nr:aminopeptidase-like protein [Thermochaetoides thermophila DSM 1495]EGS21743.1 aminopeptidase-like protein [Thermochaetoides thermophila DSM 1495]